MIITLNGSVYTTSLNPNISINFTGKQVLDETRGYLVNINGNWSFIGISQIRACVNKTIEKIALVLESPHKDEFDIFGNPLRPANGKTGCNINKKIVNRKQIIKSLNPNYFYEVHIMNPIQYQASCYSVLGKNVNRNNTNQVFRKLFSKNGANLRKDFIDNINNYKPDMIVNCCTSSGGLKKTVEVAINESNYANCICDIHPSRW